MPSTKPKSPDPVGEEGLEVRVDRRRPLVPEADQQVGHQPDRLPAEEQLHEVVAHHEHQHREREERDVREEARVARIVGHVADGVDVHHQRHERDDDQHRRRQRVDQEADGHLEAARREPGVDVAVEDVAGVDIARDRDRRQERRPDADDAQPVRQPAAELRAEQPDDDRRRQRRERHQEVEIAHGHRPLIPSGARTSRRRSTPRCGTAARGSPARSRIRRRQSSG